MITDALVGEALIPVVCWSLFCWMLGVGYAAYRAIGWADRIRSWAHHADDLSHEDGRSFSGAPLVGAATDLEADR